MKKLLLLLASITLLSACANIKTEKSPTYSVQLSTIEVFSNRIHSESDKSMVKEIKGFHNVDEYTDNDTITTLISGLNNNITKEYEVVFNSTDTYTGEVGSFVKLSKNLKNTYSLSNNSYYPNTKNIVKNDKNIFEVNQYVDLNFFVKSNNEHSLYFLGFDLDSYYTSIGSLVVSDCTAIKLLASNSEMINVQLPFKDSNTIIFRTSRYKQKANENEKTLKIKDGYSTIDTYFIISAKIN